MQLTEVSLRAEHAIIAGLAAVCFAHWGANVFYTQAFMMGIVALIALSLWTRDGIVAAMGIYISLWLIFLHIGASKGWLPEEGFSQAIDSLVWITVGMVSYNIVRCGKKVSLETYLYGIVSLAVVLSLLGLLGILTGRPAVGTLGNQNFLGAFLAISGIACYSLRKGWIPLIPIVACLIATHTSMAIGAFLIGTGYFFFNVYGVIAGGIAGAAYFLIFKTSESMMIRADYWTDALQKISGSWQTIVFGVGPGIYWEWGNMLHSEYVYIVWNLGMVGLLLVGLYIWRSCREINNRVIFAMFIAVLVDGIGNHLMHTAPTAMLAIIVFGLKDKLRIPLGSQK
jgi:hypothetical protein